MMTEIKKRMAVAFMSRLGCQPEGSACVVHPGVAWDESGVCGVGVMLAADAVDVLPGPTDDQVEAAARAFYEHATELTSWDRLVCAEIALADKYRAGMRAALAAAAGAAPQEPSIDRGPLDEGKIAEVIGGVLRGQEAMHCTRVWEAWSHQTMTEDDFSLVADDAEAVAEIARAVVEFLSGKNERSGS